MASKDTTFEQWLDMLKAAMRFHTDHGGCDQEGCGCFGSQLKQLITEIQEFVDSY